jgi:photosystem II stability/assembly factor-like uncharacterized protein
MPQTLYAAAGGAGLLQSTNGGQTWSPLPNFPGAAIAVAYEATRRRVYAGSDTGLFASEDGGASWMTLGLKGVFLAIAVSPVNPDHVLTVDDSGNVYASRDGGLTWPGQ